MQRELVTSHNISRLISRIQSLELENQKLREVIEKEVSRDTENSVECPGRR